MISHTLKEDPLFVEIVFYIVENNVGSTAAVQRHFHIQYSLVFWMFQEYEKLGIVGPSIGGRVRPVLLNVQSLSEILTCLELKRECKHLELKSGNSK